MILKAATRTGREFVTAMKAQVDLAEDRKATEAGANF